MFSHLRATSWFICLILLLLADPSLHLHRWWSNHEHALPEPSGPEKPRRLVSVDLVPGRSSGLPSVSVCPHGSFMGQQIAECPFFFYCLSLRWDRKNNPEPWNKMEPTQQYKVLMVMHYLHKYLLIQAPDSLTFFIILYCQKHIFWRQIHILPVILWQSPFCPVTLTARVCVCFQLFAVNMDYSKLKKDRPDF